MTLKKLLVGALLAAPFLFCPAAHTQFIGYVSPQTVTVKALNAQVGTATAVVANLGQNMHFVTWSVSSGSSGVGILRLEGSYDGVSFFSISDDSVLDESRNLTAEIFAPGYFPVVRVNLLSNPTASVTAQYSGTSATSGPTLGIYNPGQSLRKICSPLNQSAGSNFTCLLTSIPFGSTNGTVIFSASGSIPSGGTLSVAASIIGGATINTQTFSLTTSAVQVFQAVLPFAADNVSVIYTSGGASGATINIFYAFQPPTAAGFATGITGSPPPFTPGEFVSYNPAQLGMNGVTLPASGSTAFSNVVDFRGVKQATLWCNCTQTFNVLFLPYAEDGTTSLNTIGAMLSNMTASTWSGLRWGSETTIGVTFMNTGTGLAQATPYLPQRALSFQFSNSTAAAGTCTARLFLAY